VFKRRKPEDAPEPAVRPAAGLPPAAPDPDHGARAAGTPLPPGLTVIRPALPPPAFPQETTHMARSPFSTSPTPPAPSAPTPTTIPTAPRAPMPPSSGGAPIPGVSPGLSRPPVREPAERRTLVVGRGISVQGTVQDAERLVVEGTVEASLIHATELAIIQGGIFKGEVEVEDAEIAGTIDGTLTVRGSLVVRASGRVLGTARCRRLQVEDGGQINGKFEMLTESAGRLETAMPRQAIEPAA
jgi:cytoskeletal protein CcmA (bactofilin family)